jgi:hypothetical protein
VIHSQPVSVDRLAAAQGARRVATLLVGAAAAVLLGVLAADLTLAGRAYAIALLAGAVFPVVMWRRPELGLAAFALLATLIEQFPIDQFPLSAQPALIVTDQLPLFGSFSGSLGVTGVMVSPLEIGIVATVLIWVMKAVLGRELRLPRSYLATGVGVFAVILIMGEAWGLAHGGNFRETVNELRPFVYLLFLYLLASQLLYRPEAIRPLLWALVIGTGLKGLQGSYRFIALRGAIPRPEAVLAHEEAVFFSLFLLLCVALWLFGDRSRLRSVATAFAPFVLVADLGNNRRAAWLILLAGLAALGVIAWVRLPNRRRPVATWATALGLIGAVYLALFWNGHGGLAQPARAVRSAFAPSERDTASDLYRIQENANLALNIKLGGPFGTGFGIPIDYALPITNLTRTTPSLAYIPHNGILYVWMRLGFLGIVAFWWVIGAAILAASRLVKGRDDRLALFGALAICAVIAYVLEGYYDLGLSWYRVAVLLGIILGALEAAGRMPSDRERIGSPEPTLQEAGWPH